MDIKLIHSSLSERVIGCAINVHRHLGAGFLEKIYEEALCHELERTGVAFERQVRLNLKYRNQPVGLHCLDLIVEQTIVIELKAVKRFEDVHYATVLSYLKASRLPVALLLNFNAATLSIKRFANSLNRFIAESPKSGSTEKVVEFLRDHDQANS